MAFTDKQIYEAIEKNGYIKDCFIKIADVTLDTEGVMARNGILYLIALLIAPQSSLLTIKQLISASK